ncbi:hypothetical protein Trydic_g7474 [Trypoxylus dichotomus]
MATFKYSRSKIFSFMAVPNPLKYTRSKVATVNRHQHKTARCRAYASQAVGVPEGGGRELKSREAVVENAREKRCTRLRILCTCAALKKHVKLQG